MSRQQPNANELLRDMRNDLRFLSYRAGRPHPFVWKYILFTLLMIFGLTFLAELSATFFGPIDGHHRSARQESKEVQP